MRIECKKDYFVLGKNVRQELKVLDCLNQLVDQAYTHIEIKHLSGLKKNVKTCLFSLLYI